MIIFLWLFFAFTVAFVFGVARTIGFWGSLLVSLVFSPLIGLIVTLLFKTKEEDERQKKMLQAQQDTARAAIQKKPDISLADELTKLIDLKNKGAINETEYQNLKDKILNS